MDLEDEVSEREIKIKHLEELVEQIKQAHPGQPSEPGRVFLEIAEVPIQEINSL